MSRLKLYFLGPPLIEKDDVPVEAGRKKVISLLAYLSVAGGSHNRDTLATILWPEYDQTSARAYLRRILSFLNKTLGEDWLEVEGEQVGLKANVDLWLDVDQFHEYLSESQKHSHPSNEVCPDCVKPLTGTVELYRDDFLSGFSLQDSVNFDDWQFSQTQNLRSEMMGTLERLVSWYRSQGEYDNAIGHTRRWLEVDRSGEGAHRQLMEMYALTDRRTAALKQYEECVRILKEELATTPQKATTKLYQAIKEDVFSVEEASPAERESRVADSSYKPSDKPTNNLPIQLTSFIGRGKEIEEVKDSLATTRLQTLTGSGGCGKTRLALKVVEGLLEDYPDGVWVVELAPLSDPKLVTQEVASVLGIREELGALPMSRVPSGMPSAASENDSLLNGLIDYLKSKQLLLIMDNCEHLIEACIKLVDVLLHACPNLKVLVASREALGIAGESTFRVPSLSLPDPGNMPALENLAKYESVSLFIDRAVAAVSTFRVTDRNAPAVAQICHRLDGIPLAIELAAARVRVLEVGEITNHLDDSFRLLTGGSRTALPRQQTLRAMIDWSYNLLSEGERVLFNRLSVFMGGWTLEAAEAICEGEEIDTYEVLDLLTSLVDKSLVAAEGASSEDVGGGKKRYRLLETVRQYARDKLLDSGESTGLRDDHLEWYLGLAEKAEPELRGPDQVEWLDTLEAEHDNLRTALEWSLGSEKGGSGIRLAAALGWFLLMRYYIGEAREWLERVLSVKVDESASVQIMSARAKALGWAGLWNQDDYPLARSRIEESVKIWREVGEKSGIAGSLCTLGIVVMDHGDLGPAKELLEESLSLYREVGDKWGITLSLEFLGMIVGGYEGDYETARTIYKESLPLVREIGDKRGIAAALIGLGDTMVRQGDHEEARALVEEALALQRELGNKQGTVVSLYVLGQVARGGGDYEQAEKLFRESIVTWVELDYGPQENIIYRLEALGGVAVAQGQPGRGARLLGAAEALRQTISRTVVGPYDRANNDRSVAAARSELGEEAFEAAWA